MVAAKLAGLLVDAGYAGKSLDDWLRDGFFEQHCALFQQRPFIWHLGRPARRLSRADQLSSPRRQAARPAHAGKLIYSYLGAGSTGGALTRTLALKAPMRAWPMLSI